MAIWIVFALMTGAAVMAVLWPLSRRPVEVADHSDTQFYREQLAEIARDEERGLISSAEAEAARAEAGRRLLRATQGRAGAEAVGEPALRRRRAVSAIALSTVPLLAVAFYGAYGSPHLPALPLAARLQSDPQHLDMAMAVARIEAHLGQHPDDGRGWEVIAPVYLRGGRFTDAVRAYGNALRLLGRDASRLANYGEALVSASDGLVSADARTAFEDALALDAMNAKARYYLARAAEQDGDREAARAQYAALLSNAPSNAPWIALVRDQLARLDGGVPASMIASLPAAERQAAIKDMVESLARRLEASGGTAEDWARLVRSYAVIGERDKAMASLSRARRALSQDEAALGRLDAVAQELALQSTEPER